MAAPPSAALDFANNAYLSISLNPSSPFYAHPASLTNQANIQDAHIPLAYVGHVGELQDTHLYSIPKTQFEAVKQQVFDVLKSIHQDITAVDEQHPKARAKRVFTDDL